LIVEVLCESGPPFPPCCTIEFGVVVGDAESGYLGVAGAMLRDRWGHLLTSAEPWTDWWVGFDIEGPYLTAYGERGARVDVQTLRRALEGTIIPALERSSTLAGIGASSERRSTGLRGRRCRAPGRTPWIGGAKRRWRS